MSDLREYINKLRSDFSKSELSEKDVDKDPIKQFEKWFTEAIEGQVNEPNAMVVSTVDQYHKPSSRVLLLRNFTDKGFVFYTNYHSKKGKDIEQNPFACINFFWPELERQIRIEGRLEKQNEKESEAYFASRPRESQIGAWASQQSGVLKHRDDLEKRILELQKKYEGKDVPCPPFWGGFVLKPELFEFWQGRPSRLHDRIRYTMEFEKWGIERLYP